MGLYDVYMGFIWFNQMFLLAESWFSARAIFKGRGKRLQVAHLYLLFWCSHIRLPPQSVQLRSSRLWGQKVKKSSLSGFGVTSEAGIQGLNLPSFFPQARCPCWGTKTLICWVPGCRKTSCLIWLLSTNHTAAELHPPLRTPSASPGLSCSDRIRRSRRHCYQQLVDDWQQTSSFHAAQPSHHPTRKSASEADATAASLKWLARQQSQLDHTIPG